MKKRLVLPAFIIVMAALILPGCGMSGKKVGKTITIDKIKDFYYTEASSAFPPTFQRYHFYAKDGKYYFEHEKREGEAFPLTEDYITVHGTKELTEDEWAEFYEYLVDGVAEKRKEHVDGGTSVDFYLYWDGDKDKYQEFSFESWRRADAFADYCIKLKEAQLKAAK